MVSKKIQRLMRELERIRKEPQDFRTEEKIRDLSFQIAQKIPRKVLKKALEHSREVRNLIHPQDTSRHPMPS